MKYRMFIGSSVESLEIAYAIQEGLQHDLECTVWTQGIFEPSATALESLVKEASTFDFACFVFRPDDLLRMRGNDHPVVRDNVVFELGLFIGCLGVQNTFFVVPQNQQMHLPTDLLGLAPLNYEADRSDGNLLAAIGPAANKIRRATKDRPTTTEGLGTQDTSVQQDEKTPAEVEKGWVYHYIKGDFSKALEMVDRHLQDGKSTSDELDLVAWKGVLVYRLDSDGGIDYLRNLLETHHDKSEVYHKMALCYYLTDDYDLSRKVLSESKDKNQTNSLLKVLEMTIAAETNLPDDAQLKLLNLAQEYIEDDDAVLRYFSFLEGREKYLEIKSFAFSVLKKRKSSKIQFSLAKALWSLGENTTSLYLFSELLKEDDKNREYWGYLGNVYLNLDMTNLALAAYEKSETLQAEQEWIVSNIANLYKNLKLFDKAKGFLQKALEINNKSTYAQKRNGELLEDYEKESKKRSENITYGRTFYLNELSNI